jgi:hypothetical protein
MCTYAFRKCKQALLVSCAIIAATVSLSGCDRSNSNANRPDATTTPPSSSPTVPSTAAATPPSGPQTLVIDKVVVNSTPQSGTWLMCFSAKAGGVENTFNVPDKTYSDDGITIDMALKLSPVSVGTQVNFNMQLDDDQADVCNTSAEDKSADSFTAGTGAKNVQRDNFSYVVHYHME